MSEMSAFDEFLDELYGDRHGQCQACDRYGPVDDLSLCEDCGEKLERDLIRQRDWDYSAAAFGLTSEGREELRRQVVAQYGEGLELIAPSEQAQKSRSPRKRGKRGHYCRICKRHRPNEKFSGKGHRIHVCKECARLPAEERQSIEEEDEIYGYLRQSNISKNLTRLKALAASSNPEIARMAKLVLEIGRVHPRRKKRLRCLARERRDLFAQLEETGLILACRDY
jgi:hypothetical protein